MERRSYLFIIFVLSIAIGVSCTSTPFIPSSTPIIPTPTRVRKADRPTQPVSPETPQPTYPHLIGGPVTGAVTSTSARVFIQTNQAVSAQLQYGSDADLKNALTTANVQTGDTTGFTTIIELNHLEPNTLYYLNVLVNGVPQFHAPYPTFKSFPPDGQAIDFSFAIVNDFFWHPSQTFRHVMAENPAFVIIGGDFSHTNPTTLAEKRNLFMNRYDRNGKDPDFVTSILDRFAVAHFWDDHDFGINNADKTYPYAQLSLQVLKEFFPVYPLSGSGDWQMFSYGNADFFLLDARSQRDPDTYPDNSDKSLLDGNKLGATGQYQWLVNGLLNSQAKWKFILTPVVFNPTVPKTDSWTGYQTERHKLIDWIHSHQIGGVIFISGDLHAGGLDNGTNSNFPEMLVPPPNGMSCLSAPSPGKWSEGVYVAPAGEGCTGYGLVHVSAQPDQAQLTVKNDAGEQLFTLSVKP